MLPNATTNQGCNAGMLRGQEPVDHILLLDNLESLMLTVKSYLEEKEQQQQAALVVLASTAAPEPN
jgi:hypothetical protein